MSSAAADSNNKAVDPSSLTLWVHHDLSVCQVRQSAFLLLAKQPPDGGFDALLLWLLVEGVLAAGDAAQGAGLGLQRGNDPDDMHGNFRFPFLSEQTFNTFPRITTSLFFALISLLKWKSQSMFTF